MRPAGFSPTPANSLNRIRTGHLLRERRGPGPVNANRMPADGAGSRLALECLLSHARELQVEVGATDQGVDQGSHRRDQAIGARRYADR